MFDVVNRGGYVSGEVLPLDQRRLLAGECTRCGVTGPHDTNLCRGCSTSAVERNRVRRVKLRENGKCVRCGRRSKTYRCRRCDEKKQRKDSGQPGARSGHYQSTKPPLPTKLEVRTEADGYERTRVRYIGRATRGAPSREQLEAEQKRNVRFVKRELDKFTERFAVACSHQTQALPPIQRDAVLHETLAPLGLAFRLLEEVEDFVKARMKRISASENRAKGRTR